MDLREKLKQYEQTLQAPAPVKQTSKPDLSTWLDGSELKNDLGACFQVVRHFPMDFKHGAFYISQIQDVDPSIFAQVGRDSRLSNLNLKNILFIDTETTGLAGGTGTVPFLVGLGYFQDEGLHVEQLFIRDYHEEKAMLHHLAETLAKYSVLVSYNGKAYDMNLIHSRFLMHRMKVSTENHSHLDLLYPVRRIWRRRLQDCSLGNIEEKILDFKRHGDIPGFLIPDIFFQYIRTGNGSELTGVFKHNQWDIVSLVVLTMLLGAVHHNPGIHLQHAEDLLSHGKSLARGELFESAISSLRYAIEKEPSEEAYQLMAHCYKKTEQWQDAIQHWQYLVEKFPHQFNAYEELAKHYEHHEKNFEEAIAIVQKALIRLDITSQLHPQAQNHQSMADFVYRLKRLQRKQNH